MNYELKTLKNIVEPKDLKREAIKHIKYILEDNYREVKDISLLPNYYRGQVNFIMSFFDVSSEDLE